MRNLFRNIKVILFFVLIIFFGNALRAQEINELKEKKNKIEKEIEAISDLISKTEKESSTSVNNVKLTKRKIELKNNLIQQIDQESEQLKTQISRRKVIIDSLSNQVSLIKNDYKKIIIYSQVTSNKSNFLLLILASQDLNQAYKRIKFYQQVLKYKSQIAEKYNSTIRSIKVENSKLNENVTSLTKTQYQKSLELSNLKNEEKKYTQKIQTLNRKKKELLDDLENQRKISKKINDEIKRLIAEEARRESENLRNSNKKSNLVLSSNFKDNFGNFPLPVGSGIITGTYGESFHPVLKDIKVKNNGVDITVTKKSDVYSIFKGVVRKVFKIPGSNLAIIVRHGSYLSVYTNLTSVNVSVGQDVTSYQKIGTIDLLKGEETAILHFELWNENKTEDPSKWFKNK